MKTLPKSEKITRYLKDVFDVTGNAIITGALMERIKNQEGLVHLLIDCEIPPNYKFEWGGINNSSFSGFLIQFLHTFRQEKDVLFLFVKSNSLKSYPCWDWIPERNVVFCDKHPFYFATPFDSDEYLQATLRRSGNAGPSFGLIVKGNYVFSEWQDITKSTLRKILKDTLAIIATVFDDEAYLVYEFQK